MEEETIMKRKFLSVLLALCLVPVLLATTAAAAYRDTGGHWAEHSIERWSSHGIVQGSGDGSFDPDAQLTCAELAAILARLLKLPEAPDAGFADSSADAWYYDAINRCAAAGILRGNGDGTVAPEAPVSRERAMVMLCRALGIEPVENPDLSGFSDADAIAPYAQGYVAALVEADIIHGVTDDLVGPQLDITRAATVAILDRAIGAYADEDGATVEPGDGLTLVVAKDVKVTGAPAGSRILAAGSADGLTVNGKSVSADQTYTVPEKSPVSRHSHSYADAWSYDTQYHWHAATCGHSAVSDMAEHSFVKGVCTVCGLKPCVEVWTGYNGKKVGSPYATIEEAEKNLGENKWIVIAGDYTLTTDYAIPEGVYLDVAEKATLTVADGATLTISANSKRLGARSGATVVNHGTILVCGQSYSNGFFMQQGTLSGNALSVPDGYFLDHNGSNYFVTANAEAVFEITLADGSVVLTKDSTNAKGGNVSRIKLLDDVTKGGWKLSNDAGSVGPEVVLDLNGHTLGYNGANYNYATLNISTKVTVRNGTIRYTGKDRGAIDLLGGELIVESDAVIDGGDSYGIFTSGSSALTVSGTVTAMGNYAIAGNGSVTDGEIDDCDVTINDGAVVSAVNGIGIYHPELGTVTVNGGSITGHTGVQMCAGRLVVNGGEITSTGANADRTGSQNAMPDGAAVSVINRNYPGGTPDAEITGGTIKATGENALAVKAYDYTANTVAAWTDVRDHVAVTGGTFSSDPTPYLADGYTADAADGGWTVREMHWNDYPADGTRMPSGVVITDNQAGFTGGNGKFTITLTDEDAFLYFTQKFDRAAALAAREEGLKNGSITRYPSESPHSELNMWYGPYCASITVKLDCDVDLKGETVEPFGMDGYAFCFDGNDHTIRNAKITETSGNAGFFQSCACVENLVLDNIRVSAVGCEKAGVVAGDPNVTISGVTVRNCSVVGAKYTGAIAGYNYADILDCVVENTTVSGQYKVGGLVGYVCSDDAGQFRTITGNTLSGVTVKGETLWSGKSDYVLGKIVGNWNAAVGRCADNSFSGTTDAVGDIGKIESGCKADATPAQP